MLKFLQKNFVFVSLVLFCFITVISCQSVNPSAQSVEQNTPENYAEKKSVDWSYGGAGNPTRWAELSEEYAVCETGNSQSPVDIATETQPQENSSKIEFNYQPMPLAVTNNGNTIQVNYPQGSSIKIKGQEYQLLQFHFHTPSEHTVDENAYAMELHLVHQNSEGNLAVVGVFIKQGQENATLQPIWENIPSEKGVKEVSTVTIDASSLLPENREYYSYTGSLTTPPCSEEVSWNVLKMPIEASAEQIEQFMEIYQMNARPVQPLNQRKVQLNN